jgi:hypothetical protein
MFNIAKRTLPTIIVSIDRPDATALQVTRTDSGVTLAWMNDKQIVKAEHISFVDEPDLVNVVNVTITGDVWDLDTLIALADKAESPCLEAEPWKWAGVWQPESTPDFINMTAEVVHA